MFYAYDVNKYIIDRNPSSTVEDALQVECAAYVSIPHTFTGYGASNIEYSNDACIVEDFPGVIPGSWDRDALAPVEMLTDSDGEPTELAEVMERLENLEIIYDLGDYHERDDLSQLEHLLQLDPTVSEAQWIAAGYATDWMYWPAWDGEDYYYIPEDEYAILRAAVI